ncbi:MAG: thermonuclease family protein [Candidatus Thiodiazotropha sp.]
MLPPFAQLAATLKKAPFLGAFFVFAFGLPASSFCLEADCRPPSKRHLEVVASVIDGDTLRLKAGQKVRLIGIDTPELGRDGRPDRPFSREARKALQDLVEHSGWQILLQPGIEPRDRYRRILGHIYSPDGDNLTAALLRQGLGYQVVVAPNSNHLKCYQTAELEARKAGVGLWRDKLEDAANLDSERSGFHLLRGRIERVGRSRGGVWLNLVGGVAVKVPWQVWREMTPQEPEYFDERQLEVRGWFYRYKGKLRVELSHPAALRWL